ncbi:MAG: ubiquinol-cytochrome C chaperone family protein [Hyphomicrobiaceae bacterium]
MDKPIVPYWVVAVGLMIVLSGIADLIRRRSRPSRVASKLYGLIVTASRQPSLYADGGVPDTQEGRFEALALHTVLVLERLLAEGAEGARVARGLVETLIADIDDQMREMGVGDLTVPKRVKKAAGAVYDRLGAYRPAFATEDAEALTAAFARFGLLPDSHTPTSQEGACTSLARYTLAARRSLQAQPARALLDGRVEFPDYRPDRPGNHAAVT